ncbi:translocon-associated protein subunit beta-like [Athene cunicularia]|uniref:translocon-associated protein subunit beta-like n=1 Tax=Athene cunicularia TaxID=194338 RepID=UPI000EF66363|nr:translocon-associated protein subunit beta-like [Athene cunicularia]
MFALFCVAHREGSWPPNHSRRVVLWRMGLCRTSAPPLAPVSDLRGIEVPHTVLLQPLEAAYFNFTSATVTYPAQEGGRVMVVSGVLLGREESWLSASLTGGSRLALSGPGRFFGAMTLPSVGMLLLLL